MKTILTHPRDTILDYPETTMYGAVAMAAQAFPDYIALDFMGKQTKYSQLLAKIDQTARGLYAQYEKEGEAFVAKYKKLLHETPVATAEDAAAIAGIDLTDKAFWAQGLKMITDEIDEFVALVQG